MNVLRVSNQLAILRRLFPANNSVVILVYYTKGNKVKRLKIIALEFSGSKLAELSKYCGHNILEVHVVTGYLSKAASMKIERLLNLGIPRKRVLYIPMEGVHK